MIYIVPWQMLWELVGNLSCKFLIPAVLEASSWGGGVPQGRWSTHLPTCQTCTRRREEALTWRCHSGFRVCISMTQSLDSFTKMHVQPRLLCCQQLHKNLTWPLCQSTSPYILWIGQLLELSGTVLLPWRMDELGEMTWFPFQMVAFC